MRKNLFEKIKQGGKGGAPGQWSARKAQMLAREYKAKGAAILLMALAKARSRCALGQSKSGNKSGKPSTQGSEATGERYLPEKAIKHLAMKSIAEPPQRNVRLGVLANSFLNSLNL